MKSFVKFRSFRKYETDKKNCSTCEYYFANAELGFGFCRMDKYKSIDIDNAVNTLCKEYKRWSLL